VEARSRGEGQLRDATPKKLADFERLVERLEAMGETLAAARADKDRWGSEPDPSKRYVMMNREIAERKERERRQREAAKQQEGKKAPGAPAPKGDGDLQPQE
jgi:DNA invertase Pin-like site-specific DNA recombinase